MPSEPAELSAARVKRPPEPPEPAELSAARVDLPPEPAEPSTAQVDLPPEPAELSAAPVDLPPEPAGPSAARVKQPPEPVEPATPSGLPSPSALPDPILPPAAVDALLAWYEKNARDLPWRHTSDPYRVWISEIMLQQTRVEAVKPYYARFLSAFPTVADLAAAPEDQLLKLWEGLGYYSRARNLQKAARVVVNDCSGSMPSSPERLLELPGIGDYTAGAIASIAFGLPVPAVDGNVLRVLSRVSGSRSDVTRPETKSAFRSALLPVIPSDRAGAFTQSMIEIGATVCGPNAAPQCAVCPLAPWCAAYRDGLTDLLPVRSAKKPRRVVDLTVLLIRDGRRTALCRRPPRGLLAGLYEYPNLPGHLTPDELLPAIRSLGLDPIRLVRVEDARHIFTHVEWHMIAYSVRVSPEIERADPRLLFVSDEDLRTNYALPSAFSAYTKYGKN